MYEVEFYFSSTQTISSVLTDDALSRAVAQIEDKSIFSVPGQWKGETIYIVPDHVKFLYVSAIEEDSDAPLT